MTTFESTLESPLAWVTDRLEGVDLHPGRRAVVLVSSARQAHAVRRHVCVERARPEWMAGVWLLRPVDLAREVLVRAGTVCLPGWEAVRRLRIVRLFESAALADQLRYFSAEQLRVGQGYVDAFAHTIADLEAGGLDAQLARTLALGLAGEDRLAADRLHDVAVTWAAADCDASMLATTAQLLAAATVVVGQRPQLLAPFGPIFAVLTASPATVLLRFLRTLPAARVLLQDARPLRTGTQRWRALMGSTLAAAVQESSGPPQPERAPPASELGLVQRFLFEVPETLTDPERPRSRGPDGSVDLEEYSSIEDEIEAAAIWVAEQIAAGIPLEEIALIVPEVDPYARMLADRLARIGAVPGAPTIGVSVAGGLCRAASPAGMRLHGLLQAVARWLEAEATIRVLPWLRRRDQGSTNGRERLSPSRAAELVYGAGIVGGSSGDSTGLLEWVPRLTRRCAELRQLVDAGNATANARGASEGERRLDVRKRHDAARWLRDVEPMLPAITALQELTHTILGGAPLPAAWQLVRAFCERWIRLPPDPPDLLAGLDRSLQLLLTDRVAGGVSGAASVRAFMDILEHERQPVGRFGEPCIFIGTGAQAAGVPFAATRILGLAEGALPHTPHDDPIVPDGLRQRVEAAVRAQPSPADIVLPRLADRVLDDLHDVFRVVRGTRRRLALSAPRQWVDRSEREVSGIMLEVATALGRQLHHAAEEGDVPTAARLRAAYLNAGCAARRLGAGARPLSPRAECTAASQRPPAIPSGWTDDSALAIDQLWRIVAVQESSTLSGIDGVVAAVWPAIEPPGLVPQRPISASAAVRLLECPHRFLLERVLYLTEPSIRPSMDVIAPVVYGEVFHVAADRFFREAGPGLCQRQGRVEQWVARAQEIAAAAFTALQHAYPMRGADGIARERNRLLRQIAQLVHYEWQLPVRDFLDSELNFGDPEPVRLELDAGTLYVRGAIDRIDRLAPGALSVRDLKTGRVRDFSEDPINPTRDLQIGLYTLALESSGYAAGGRVVEAVYVYPSAAREPDRAFTGTSVDLLRHRTREWLGIAYQLLSAGAFPRTPNVADCVHCPFVPACGEGAQQRSAAKLAHVTAGHPLDAFARFKRQASAGEGDGGGA